MIIKSKQNLALLSLVAGSLVSSNAFAAAFAVKEQSSAFLGTAFAGAASASEDSSTGFYNSAGLTELNEAEFQAAAMFARGHFKLTPTSATNSLGAAVTPANSSKPKPGPTLIPAIHMSMPLTGKWYGSFNITTPFGLKTEYGEGSPARYVATRSELRTINMSPSVAYKINDSWSVGGGLDVMYAKAHLDATIIAGATDGYQKNDGEDWTHGFHIGTLYKVSKDTKMGLHYRHKYSVKLRGDRLQRTTATAAETRAKVAADTTLPESIVYSVYHKYDDNWSIMADVEWMKWSRFKNLAVTNTDAGSTTVVTHDFKNVFRFSLGSVYKLDDTWKFRFGAAIDKSPVRTEHRTARIPDSDRVWLAVGAQYNFDDHFKADFGYSHIFFKRASISDSAPAGAALTGQTLVGEYKSHADVVGLQLTWKFM